MLYNCNILSQVYLVITYYNVDCLNYLYVLLCDGNFEGFHVKLFDESTDCVQGFYLNVKCYEHNSHGI